MTTQKKGLLTDGLYPEWFLTAIKDLTPEQQQIMKENFLKVDMEDTPGNFDKSLHKGVQGLSDVIDTATNPPSPTF